MKGDSFKDFVLDQLCEVPSVQGRRLFGADGRYADQRFFGILPDGKLFFKTDDQTAKPYEEQGLEPFRPGKKQTLKHYFEVPALVLEDQRRLTDRATKALKVEPKRT